MTETSFSAGLKLGRNLRPTFKSFAQKYPNYHSQLHIRVSRTSHPNAQQGVAGSAALSHHLLACPQRLLFDELEAVCDTCRDNGD